VFLNFYFKVYYIIWLQYCGCDYGQYQSEKVIFDLCLCKIILTFILHDYLQMSYFTNSFLLTTTLVLITTGQNCTVTAQQHTSQLTMATAAGDTQILSKLLDGYDSRVRPRGQDIQMGGG